VVARRAHLAILADVPLILGLLVAVAALATLAGRLQIPYPILLVLGGAALALVPELPQITLAPELVFLLFVPPLVYAAAFTTSWRDLVSNARPIALLALGLVLATMTAVAVVAHAVIPGFNWPSAFVLGAVVANTDTVAIEAIGKRLRLPRRAMMILMGEGLLNDAVGLVAFRLTVAAAVSGVFSPWRAGADFVVVGAAAVAIGIAVGEVTTRLLTWLDDPPV
jgi:NhaP-type Na+/H+ or K+/H+ antiporter